MSPGLYIPYSHLSTEPLQIRLCADLVFAEVSLIEPGGRHCLLTLSEGLRFELQLSQMQTVPVEVGTAFDVEYRGDVTEVRIGRPFRISDCLCY
jgi:hypothetical protein